MSAMNATRSAFVGSAGCSSGAAGERSARVLWAINPRQTERQRYNYYISPGHGNAYSNTDGRIATVAVCKAVRSATHSSNVLSTTERDAWLPCSTTTTCSTRTLEHGVSITNEDQVAAHVPSCTCKRPAPMQR